MRASQVVLSAIGVLLATISWARPAVGQERTERVRWERVEAARASGEDRHEARRRVAAERRAAVLEWHRARRAGLDPRAAAAWAAGPGAQSIPVVLEAAGDARVRRTAAGRRSDGGGRLAPAAAGAAPAMWREEEPAAWWGEREAWWEEPWSGVPRHEWDAWRGRAGVPFGAQEIVCVARIREGRWAGSGPFDLGYGRARWRGERADDALRFRARCRPVPPFVRGLGFAPPHHALGPGFWGAFAPSWTHPAWPAPHRFYRRFHPPAGSAPGWDGAGWFVDEGEGAADVVGGRRLR